MFSLKGILKSCGSGCQLLWSDPNKQTGGYGVVEKEEDDLHEDAPEDDGLLSPYDAVTSQPVWSERPSIVKNILPFHRMSTPNLSEIARTETVIAPRMSKNEEVTKSQSNIFKQQKKTTRSSSIQNPSSAFVFSSPIVKSKSISGLTMPSKSGNTYKSSRKQKSEEVRLQIVSVV